MAHPTLVAKKQAIAYQRLMAAAQILAKRHGLTEQGKALAAITSRDPNLAQAQQTEALADLLEGMAKTKGGVVAPSDKEAVQEAAIEADAPLTVETVDEKPLVTTETVQIVDTGARTVIADAKPAKGDKHAN